MTVVHSSPEVIERLTTLSNIKTFDRYQINARSQAKRWVEAERLQWIRTLDIPPGDAFHQLFTDRLAAEGTKVLMQHSNPRQASAQWWKYHIEPIHWLIGMLATWSPSCNQPSLPIKERLVTEFR